MQALENLYRVYGKRVEFLLVYVRPTGEDGEPDEPPVSVLEEANREVKNAQDRAQLVSDCVRKLAISFRCSMDDEQHSVHKKYDAWPSRACLVDRSGVVVYASVPSVSSVDPMEIEPELKQVLQAGK